MAVEPFFPTFSTAEERIEAEETWISRQDIIRAFIRGETVPTGCDGDWVLDDVLERISLDWQPTGTDLDEMDAETVDVYRLAKNEIAVYLEEERSRHSSNG